MNAKMTEIEVTDLAIDELTKHNMSPLFSYRCAFIYGVRNRENELLPQIEKLQGEIDDLKKTIDIANDVLWKDSKEIAQLTAKHDRLVKGLKELESWHTMIEEEEVYTKADIQKLIEE